MRTPSGPAQHFPRLDVIINNACQTIRRPPAYYEHMMRAEAEPFDDVPPALQRLLACDRHVLRAALRLGAGDAPGAPALALTGRPDNGHEAPAGLAPSTDADVRALSSAQLSQVPLLLDDHSTAAAKPLGAELFPRGAVDVNNQQLDLRQHNSWLLRMHEARLGHCPPPPIPPLFTAHRPLPLTCLIAAPSPRR